MYKSNLEIELLKRYALGEREFSKAQLRRAQLRGVNLNGINLREADLSYVNLRDADLSNADLRGCYFNEANLIGVNLKGANLEGAYLIKTYLTRANLTEANLHKAYLTNAFLTNVNLSKANLTDAYLNNAELTGAYLTGAYYNPNTHFNHNFNPVAVGMQQKSEVNSSVKKKTTVAELLEAFHNLIECSHRYLGSTLTVKYLESSRPDFEWLNNFNIDSTANVCFTGGVNTTVNTMQLKWFEKWINTFIKSCSYIIQDFPCMIQRKENQVNQVTSMASSVEAA